MPNGDGKQQQPGKMRCPFSGQFCKPDICPVAVEITKQAGGIIQKGNMCSLPSMVMLLSELNSKIGAKQAEKAQQKLVIPQLRG